jgi:hypothetical protein
MGRATRRVGAELGTRNRPVRVDPFHGRGDLGVGAHELGRCAGDRRAFTGACRKWFDLECGAWKRAAGLDENLDIHVAVDNAIHEAAPICRYHSDAAMLPA